MWRRPAYTTQHPAVLFDEAHHNFHRADGLYKPFVNLVTNDGYRVAVNGKPFTKDILGTHQVLVIANAQGVPGGGPARRIPRLPRPSARSSMAGSEKVGRCCSSPTTIRTERPRNRSRNGLEWG